MTNQFVESGGHPNTAGRALPPISRILIPLDPHDPNAWIEALNHALDLCEPGETDARRIILAVPSRPQMKNMTIAGHLGAASAKTLAAGQTVSFVGGVTLQAEGVAQLRVGPEKVVIIAYYADDKALDKLDGLTHVEGVVVVPSWAGSVAGWTKRWTPQVHGQAAAVPVILIADPKVEKALEALSRSVNLGPEVLHSSDDVLAEQTFRILRNKGHKAAPADIRSWAIKNGWKEKAATRLETLAARILLSKAKPSLARIPEAETRYANWV